MEKEIKSYICVVQAESGLLLGGVIEHMSSRIGGFDNAVNWCNTVVKGNVQVNRHPVVRGIYPSDKEPEI